MCEEVNIIIPARSGSKSIKDKNISNLDGHTLLEYSIKVAKQCCDVNKIIVSTNSTKYKNLALKYGADVPFLRPENISGDQSVDMDWFKNLFDYFKNDNLKLPKFWVWLRPTTPIRSPDVINQAIKVLKNCKNADSLRSVHLLPESPFKWYEKDNNGYLKPFGFEYLKNDFTVVNKQELKDVWVPNGYVDIIKSDNIIKNNNLFGKKIIPFRTNFTIEVDSQQELDYLSFMIKYKGNPVFN